MKMMITEAPETTAGAPSVRSRPSVHTRPAKRQADSAELYSMLLNESPLAMLVIDEHGRISYANRAAGVLLPPHAVQVGNAVPLQPELAAIAPLVTEAIAEQRRVETDVHLPALTSPQRPDEHVYHAVAAPIGTAPGTGVWVMIEDVTDRMLTEQIRKDFVTNASHELRTPLSLIHGYIETLKSGLIRGTSSLNRCLDVMEKHSKRMMRIIEDMLTISRLESGDAQLRAETFLVRGCVEDVLEHLTPLVDARQPVITLSFPEPGGILQGDRFYWDQIFTNLMENALKENQSPGLHLTISGEWLEHECVLKVTDNGIGIPAVDIPFVFKRFFRCAKHHSQETRGTGLGLSIVKRAVEAHGGSIEVHSKPGIETVFTMRVPLHQAGAADHSSPSPVVG